MAARRRRTGGRGSSTRDSGSGRGGGRSRRAGSGSGSRGRGGGERRARRLQRWRVAARVAAALAFVAGFALATWVVRLDRIVVARFEGQRFQVPSKVLSAPTILYPGLDARRVDLVATLRSLGYREQPEPGGLPLGAFRREPGTLRVHLRAFQHPSRPEPAREVAIRLRRGRIERITELAGMREMGAVLLEPELVGAYYGPDREQRDLVRLEALPRHLVEAVLAVEDRRFHEHHGLDVRRVAGAMLANLRAGSIRQGGSTLTQQLVKNFFLTPERTLSRKLQEAVMALLVEARYDKRAILESYLNEIYLGQRGATAVHGVGEAARLYFGKSAEDLTPGESAVLAAMIQSPNRISPHHDPELARERRDLVLRLMRDQGRLDEGVYRRAVASPLRVAERAGEPSRARYFLDVLRRQLPEVYDREILSREGLRIYSTLDPRLQRAAVAALRRGLERLEAELPGDVRDPGRGRPPQRLEGCLVALRPQTGEIVALVGGRDYGRSQFDRCTQARRPVGSVFKPVVYLAALEPGPAGRRPTITLASVLEDAPLQVETPDGTWRPENYDREFRGPVSARRALEESLNVPTVRLARRVGLGHVADAARRLGIESPLPPVPSLALGTAELSPLEVARAYATLAGGGTRPTPHTFEDVVTQAGEPVERRRIELQATVDPGAAYLVTSLLEGVVDRGTGRRVRALGLEGPVAGKTGTTDEERDLWFVGYTPELVAAVWVGFDRPQRVGVAASRGALPIWVDFVRSAAGARIRGAFSPPPGVEEHDVHPATGALALSGCPARRSEYFLEQALPEHTCPAGGRRPGSGLLDWFRRWL